MDQGTRLRRRLRRAAAWRFAGDGPGSSRCGASYPGSGESRIGHDAVLRLPRCDDLVLFDRLRGMPSSTRCTWRSLGAGVPGPVVARRSEGNAAYSRYDPSVHRQQRARRRDRCRCNGQRGGTVGIGGISDRAGAGRCGRSSTSRWASWRAISFHLRRTPAPADDRDVPTPIAARPPRRSSPAAIRWRLRRR